MARTQRQRLNAPDVVAGPHKAHADAAREHLKNAKSDEAKACFSQAVMCHDTAARMTARADKLAAAAQQYRASAAFWDRRKPDLARHLNARADDVDTAIRSLPDHVDKWNNRGLEYSARGHEQDKAHRHQFDKAHENWLKHLTKDEERGKGRAARNTAGAQE